MTPLFTVIIPTYNRSEFLRAALKSLSLQTFKDYEASIIDDGSIDDTSKVFEEFKSQENWKFIRFETNKRQAYCRNYAIKNSNGKYITFLDADDMWLPERLEKFAELVSKNPNAGFVFSNGYIMQYGMIIGKFFDETREIPKGKLDPCMAISDKWLPYVTTNVAFPKIVIKKTGFFREDMSHLEDMELYVKILKHFEVDYIPIPLSIYRIHTLTKDPQSLTLKWEDGIKDFLIAIETANPREEKRRELKDHVYHKQAVVFLKNCLNLKSRQYLLKTSTRDVKFYFIYAATFAPRPVLLTLRTIYRITRSIKQKIFPLPDYKHVQKFADSLK
ncbi:MAG: glycosyltransferase family 2 protein [Elusimicrobiota bacterium]